MHTPQAMIFSRSNTARYDGDARSQHLHLLNCFLKVTAALCFHPSFWYALRCPAVACLLHQHVHCPFCALACRMSDYMTCWRGSGGGSRPSPPP
jgi:hypothetical protein